MVLAQVLIVFGDRDRFWPISRGRQRTTEQPHCHLRACENPQVHIIGHPTARRIGKGPQVDVDFGELFRACAATGTALEINSSPQRLDLPPEHQGRAGRRGEVRGQHRLACGREPGFLPYGIGMAQRGWLTADDVINAWPLSRLRQFLRKADAPARRPRRPLPPPVQGRAVMSSATGLRRPV
jgi:DNA polymerase (family 10)